ncbi:uncharacterized protein LOC113345447 isoform X2 [Papaver somniferum]|uniref:uncharacterized protein LOC113345447 isoform X2 n=1 Tax=Papaver somniferum TaxID=3469 RepID=UPI000E6FCEB2|nr:uncharacterized protein LOC113345447 isoform X2 [Papaver somniferum]
MSILRNGKRLTVDEEHNSKNNNKKKRAIVKKIDDAGSPYLPEELMENIVIRLQAKGLSRFSCVSKKWYNFILKDSKFAVSHFIQNSKKLNLIFNLLNVPVLRDTNGSKEAYLFSLEEEEEKDNDLLKYKLLPGTGYHEVYELVGYCNGLACVKLVTQPTDCYGAIHVINPTRNEALALAYITPTTQGGDNCTYLCHGFGFDSTSQEYKAVLIFTNSTTAGDQEFVCMVVALGGTNSWRKIIISADQMSPSSPDRTTTSKANRRSATLCGGGHLFWRVTNSTAYNDDVSTIDMLLSFDIHTEKIQFIPLPTECRLTPMTTTTRDEHQCLEVDHHLLEFKGYLCVARSEKIMISSNGHHHHHLGYSCNGLRSTLCCCSFKVQLYILKDKVKQVWTKGETYDLQIKEEGLQLPAPFCCYRDSTTTSPPTRISSFSDQLLLYWFDGKCLMFYNLQRKQFKVLDRPSSRAIFETKKKNGATSGCSNIGNDDNFHFPYMDYQLHAQPENMLSLKTFIAGGETREFYSISDFQQSLVNDEKEPAGCYGYIDIFI